MYDCDSPIVLDVEGGNLVYVEVMKLSEPDASGGRSVALSSSDHGGLPIWKEAASYRNERQGPI